jgi:hypothetical protein
MNRDLDHGGVSSSTTSGWLVGWFPLQGRHDVDPTQDEYLTFSGTSVDVVAYLNGN